MLEWDKIYEGWRNHLLPPKKLKGLILRTAKERAFICSTCKYSSANSLSPGYRPDKHCLKCGCTLSAKTKCLSCSCPLPRPKWKAVVTTEQEEEIKQNVK
jgi:hypothetical protein